MKTFEVTTDRQEKVKVSGDQVVIFAGTLCIARGIEASGVRAVFAAGTWTKCQRVDQEPDA